MARKIKIGSLVEAASTEAQDHKFGTVMEVSGDKARVSWDGHAQTWERVCDLDVAWAMPA